MCGKPLVYFKEAKEMKCSVCGGTFSGYASCEDGHFVCDECHEKKGVEAIMDVCRESKSRNPIAIMQELMENPYIYMHGPEHHIMVGAALLTAYHNCGGEVELDTALDEMKARGSQYPGGSCGFWGCCGAAVSVGMYMSIATQATPLTTTSWKYSNQITAEALKAIGDLGGPRCCKRNSFTAAKAAVEFTKKHLGIEMELPEKIECEFSLENKQCKKKACPYYKGTMA